MNLTTLAAIKARLADATKDANAERDTALTALISSVSADVERECNRKFDYSATLTEYHSPNEESDFLYLRRPPAHSIASVHVSTSVPRVWDATTLLTAGTAYDFETDDQPPYATKLYRLDGQKFPCGPKVVRVVYACGFGGSAPAPFDVVPADLAQAVIETIWSKYQKGAGGMYHLTSKTSIEGNVTGVRFVDAPDSAVRVFEHYRLRSDS